MPKTCMTTAKDFDLFKRTANKWLRYFGMMGWRVEFQHGVDEDEDGARAMCGVNQPISDRVASIALCKDWGSNAVVARDVEQAAFHETMELLVWKLAAIALEYGAPTERVIDETHHLIRTFENTIFQDVKP